MRRALQKAILAVVLGAALGLLALLAFFPVLRGALCPGCYGLARVAPGVWAEARMTPPEREALLHAVAAAQAQVLRAFGASRAHLRLLACATPACDRRLGGRGAAAVTYSLGSVAVVRVAPGGQSALILAHELTHTETHARLGVWGQVRGHMPVWMDEGLAVIVSNDPRHLGPAQGPGDGPGPAVGLGVERCLRPPRADLPATPAGWGRRAATSRDIYAEAACATLVWMAQNDGWSGLWARIEAGKPLP